MLSKADSFQNEISDWWLKIFDFIEMFLLRASTQARNLLQSGDYRVWGIYWEPVFENSKFLRFKIACKDFHSYGRFYKRCWVLKILNFRKGFWCRFLPLWNEMGKIFTPRMFWIKKICFWFKVIEIHYDHANDAKCSVYFRCQTINWEVINWSKSVRIENPRSLSNQGCLKGSSRLETDRSLNKNFIVQDFTILESEVQF